MDNKAVAAELCARFSASDIPGVLALMTDDATWWIPGEPGTHPSVGQRSKAQITQLFYAMFKGLKNGLKMTIKGMIAEGDKVALEAESYGELKNGRTYNQHYHLLLEFRGGKISAVREYLDTQHVLAVWFAQEAEGVKAS